MAATTVPVPAAKRAKTTKEDKAATGEKKIWQAITNCIQQMSKHGWNYLFKDPVDTKALGLDDYEKFVQQPMDISTIKKKQEQGLYSEPKELKADFDLMYHNCTYYNSNHDNSAHLVDAAKSHMEAFQKKWDGANIDNRWARHLAYKSNPLDYAPPAGYVDPSPTPKPTASKAQPKTAAAKGKGAARAKSKPAPVVPMTYEQKCALGMELQKLNHKHLMQVLHIVQQANRNMGKANDGEVELDIESLDVKTLWKLDEFVKKILAEPEPAAPAAAAPATAPAAAAPATNGNAVAASAAPAPAVAAVQAAAAPAPGTGDSVAKLVSPEVQLASAPAAPAPAATGQGSVEILQGSKASDSTDDSDSSDSSDLDDVNDSDDEGTKGLMSR